MKTAISIPDETFERAERLAAELRMSRSEFITRAIRHYAAELEAEALTGRIDAALDIAWPRGVTADFTQHGEDGADRPGAESGDDARAPRRGDVRRAAGADGLRPYLVVQAQPYNDSRLPTVLAAAISSNTGLAALPGSVFLPAAVSGLPMDAVVDVTEVRTIDRSALHGPLGAVPLDGMRAVDDGLRTVLGLG